MLSYKVVGLLTTVSLALSGCKTMETVQQKVEAVFAKA